MPAQIITFQNCLDPASYYDFVVDDSLVLSGDTIFADYECWTSTGNVGGGPTGTVIFSGYTTCEQCNDDFNGWQFEHCQIPGAFVYFGLKNSEVNQYFQSTGATISYDGTCYNYTGVYEQGTGSTTYNYTVAQLISENALFTNCIDCLTPPSPTPTPTPSPTPTLCYSGVTDSASWYYTDCCGVYQSGSFSPTYICYDPNYPTSGVSGSANPCSVVCPSVTPTPTPTLTQTPSETPSETPTPTNTVTPTKTPSLTPTPSVTPTNTPTNTPSSTLGSTPSVTPTNTPTNTPSLTPSVTVSVTPTVTPSPSLVPTGCTQYTFSLHPIYFLTQAGPYNISGTTTGGTIVLIATGVTTSQLLSGYTALVCYSITTFTVQSTGTCTNSVNFTLPVPIVSPTPTPTKTPTPSPSGNPVATPSVTPTATPTNTVTPTLTPTPSGGCSDSVRNTLAATNSYSAVGRQGMVYSSSNNKAYVLNASSVVQSFVPNSTSLTNEFTWSGSSLLLGYNSTNNKLYSWESSFPVKMLIRNLNTNTTSSISISGITSGLGKIEYNSVLNKIYAFSQTGGNFSVSQISVIDGSTDTFTNQITGITLSNPEATVYNPNNNKLYFAQSGRIYSCSGDTISLDGTSLPITSAGLIALDVANNIIYLVSASTVYKIDVATNTTLTLNSISGATWIFGSTRSMIYNPDNGKLYISRYSTLSDGFLGVLDPTTGIFSEIIGDGISKPLYVPTNTIYGINDNALYEICGSSLVAVSPTPTPTLTKTPTPTKTPSVTPTPSPTYQEWNMVGCTNYCSGVVFCSGSYSVTLYTLPNVVNIYDPGVTIYTNNSLTTTFDGFFQIGLTIYEIVSGSVTTQYTIGDGC